MFPLHLKGVDPERYGSLVHPGDSFSYDMFSQVSQLLREPTGIDPLNGMRPQHMLAMGESQSAARLTTFINALQPLYNPYEAYIVHSRGDGASALAQEPQVEIPVPDGTRIREDLNALVMTFAAETDVLGLRYIDARQPRFRYLSFVGGCRHGTCRPVYHCDRARRLDWRATIRRSDRAESAAGFCVLRPCPLMLAQCTTFSIAPFTTWTAGCAAMAHRPQHQDSM